MRGEEGILGKNRINAEKRQIPPWSLPRVYLGDLVLCQERPSVNGRGFAHDLFKYAGVMIDRRKTEFLGSLGNTSVGETQG